jgi:dUTP pyrophosphatase
MSALIEVLREPWADPSVPLPAYATDGAAGADLRANLPAALRAEGLLLKPGRRLLVPTGLRIAVPLGLELQIRPRSGLALKQGIGVPNAPGTIDSDYRGPVGILLVNFGPTAFRVRHGARIAQAVLAAVPIATYVPVQSLDATARGRGGFGSTGEA